MQIIYFLAGDYFPLQQENHYFNAIVYFPSMITFLYTKNHLISIKPNRPVVLIYKFIFAIK